MHPRNLSKYSISFTYTRKHNAINNYGIVISRANSSHYRSHNLSPLNFHIPINYKRRYFATIFGVYRVQSGFLRKFLSRSFPQYAHSRILHISATANSPKYGKNARNTYNSASWLTHTSRNTDFNVAVGFAGDHTLTDGSGRLYPRNFDRAVFEQMINSDKEKFYKTNSKKDHQWLKEDYPANRLSNFDE